MQEEEAKTLRPVRREAEESIDVARPSDATSNALPLSLPKDPAPASNAPVAALEVGGGSDKSGVSPRTISVPSGSGTVAGMGESFSAQLSTGVATFSVPFALPGARGSAQPSLALSYMSSAGAGLAGMGWNVALPFIARQTDRGLPGYDDRASWHENQDRFVFNGGQELVPICTVGADLACAGALPDERMPPWSAGSQYFRSRVEGSFTRFFWSPDHLTWRVQDKSGVTLELGVPLDGSADVNALERNPDAPREIYKWHLARQYDTHGNANPATAAARPTPFNAIVYKYRQDAGKAYLSDIFHTSPRSDPSTAELRRYVHHTRLAYEQRTDPSSSFRSGWRIDQRLRLLRVDVTSKTFNGGESGGRRLVRRYHLAYDASSHVSLLASVKVEGRCAGSELAAPPEDERGELPPVTGCSELPPMTFSYSRVAPFTAEGQPGVADLPGYEGFDERVRQITGDPPHSIDEELADLFDVDSDALPDVLVTQPGRYGDDFAVFFNSPAGARDAFGAAERLGVRGVLGANSNSIKLGNPNVAPLDLDGDATFDLLHMPKQRTYSIYTPQREAGSWILAGRAIQTASAQSPKIDFGGDALDTRIADVNFDGLVDVVVSTGTEFQTFFSLGRYPGGDGQFGSARFAGATQAVISNDPVVFCVPHSGNPVRLSDPDVRIAEMNGDGIPDIVRVRRGDVRYWPGRGNGFWGTGPRGDCPAGVNGPDFGADRHLQMAESPFYADVEATALQIDDVNGDGFDDLVEIGHTTVSVWLNVDGVGWTKRHVIADTPAAPAFSRRVRIVDVNGSGTRDILWGEGRGYKYMDLQGGQKPWLLTRIDNGLGKSTEIEYATSTAEMLAAERRAGACDAEGKPWSSPWCSKMPTVAHVVKRVADSDNLAVAGKPPGRYVSEYDYRDPVFEGRQREFRGFRKARARRIGDANSPTDVSESTFLLGECEDETVGAFDNQVDDCSIPERWRDNPREALKGLPTLTERYDESGVYLSSEAVTYRLRRLYVGLDGREVRHAFESKRRTFLYDTALGVSATPAFTTLDLVELERDFFDPLPAAPQVPLTAPLPAPPSLAVARRHTVRVRAPTRHAELEASSVVDFFGNQLVANAHGCVTGGACPGNLPADAGPGIAPDETIQTFTLPFQPPGESTGWLWRTRYAYVQGSVHVEARNLTETTYTPQGDPEQTRVTLRGTLPLDRSHATAGAAVAPTPATASALADHTFVAAQRSYSPLGVLIQESGPNGRCRTLAYDDAYSSLPTLETVFTGGCGVNPLVTSAHAYDRGLGLVTVAVDMQLQATFVDYDGFGRLVELRRPPPAGSSAEGPRPPNPSVTIDYFLPSPTNPVKYSVIRTRTQDGADPSVAAYLEALSYVDGLGRTVLSLSEADPTAGDEGRWIASGLHEYDAKGAVCRKYLPFFHDGGELQFPLAALPDAAYGHQRYDAFGRQLQSFDIDGTVTLQSRYHALSTDLFDASDLEPGPHQGTPASTRSDGHGRTIASSERIHQGSSIEERQVRTRYLTTGQPEVITRLRVGTSERVVRWMRYDSLGRLVLNVEPHTTVGFSEDPSADPSTLKAWRYAYDATGDLVGTSDARGCGQNFFYDGAGRRIGEDYSPCESHHPSYSAPAIDPASGAPSGNGIEILYVYDTVPTQGGAGFAPPGYAPNPDFLKGRLSAVFDRGATAWTTYDARGRATRIDRRIARADTDPNAPLAQRYTNRWFSKDFAYDAADRMVATTTGSTRTNLRGALPSGHAFDPSRDQSAIVTEYTARGTVAKVHGSYGALVQRVDREADGLVNEIVYGDAASTTTSFSFDGRRRLRTVTTYRGPPELWGPPLAYQPAAPSGPTTFQLVLQDEDYSYDSVNNPIEIRDWRDADAWPAGAKPVTRKIQYDDLNRVRRVDYEYPAGDDAWTSPFAPELGGASDPRRADPSPHVAFDRRTQWQTFDYDWLGNTSNTDDDANGFYDRSLGAITNDAAGGKPYQLASAAQPLASGPRSGAVTARYDSAGNLVRLDLVRRGPCLGSSDCSQRFDYRWDEVGRLVHARRWDVPAASITTPTAPLPASATAADLRYLYDAADQRVVKSATDGAASSHTVYVFDSLEIRRAALEGSDYALSAGNAELEVPYLSANGVRIARVVFEDTDDSEPRLNGSSRQHVFFELGDHLGSTNVVLDKATGELVERSTFQAYGATEGDYRPERWEGFREDYRFTGKEEDVEVGLTYFGKRFLSTNLGRWMSPDPLAVSQAGEADFNLYAYVSGEILKSIDPLGLMKIVSAQHVDEYRDDVRPSARKLAKSLGISRVGTHYWSSGIVEQARDRGGDQRLEQGDGGAVLKYVERIDVLGHTGSGLLNGPGYVLDRNIAERLSPYLRDDVKIVVHGCGCGLTYDDQEAFMKNLPSNATMYTHDIKALPGMPFNWVAHRIVQDEKSPSGRLVSIKLSGSHKVVGEVLSESYVWEWAGDQTNKDLRTWLKTPYFRITDDVRAIMQETLDARTNGRPVRPAPEPETGVHPNGDAPLPSERAQRGRQ